ncbi:erythromycin esterase family protein [Streptoalloteichus hindustanus]|uniref:Erythromycin esterase n=1 Tax=Streptoalloteichus hindustanus TaxID=2017 RepID=A0A1M5MG97_STRHI|nr:erythromycin esterase family protein [Streptoalloteichus hindustanus]SHG76241.1 erythromycin esterase [Streptoalloteichus hindustanus]
MSLPTAVRSLGWHFADDAGLGAALDHFLDSRPERPQLLGLGEPTHALGVFPLLRNRVLRHLVEHQGCRSIVVESNCLTSPVVNDYVTTGDGDIDTVLSTGFSHGFGGLPGARELVTWLRDVNRGREPEDQIRFFGFDAPTEMTSAASPRVTLTGLHRFLTAHLGPERVPHSLPTIESLLGDDDAWTNPAAAMDSTQSVGGSAEAHQLRVIADDLVAVLETETPGLRHAGTPAEFDQACLFARITQGMLRYHAAMADPGPGRVGRMLAIRDAMMADNLVALAKSESRRGLSLVFAHNAHLQRSRGHWRLGEMDLRWWSAGAITADRLGGRYAVIASDFGVAPELGVAGPEPDSLHGVLADATEACALYPANALAGALDGHPALAPRVVGDPRYIPLDARGIGGVDAVVFVKDVSTQDGQCEEVPA